MSGLGKNIFGGGNAASLYVPLSDVEQECLARLVEMGELSVHIVDWGIAHKPIVTHGDARVRVVFRMDFDRPVAPVNVYHFKLELRTGSGKVLFRDKQSTMYEGRPIQVAAGVFLDMVWDIQLRHLDPALVREVLPHVTGLTSRLQDRDTGDMTLLGNMRLTPEKQAVLTQLRRAEAGSRKHTAERLAHAVKTELARKH